MNSRDCRRTTKRYVVSGWARRKFPPVPVTARAQVQCPEDGSPREVSCQNFIPQLETAARATEFGGFPPASTAPSPPVGFLRWRIEGVPGLITYSCLCCVYEYAHYARCPALLIAQRTGIRQMVYSYETILYCSSLNFTKPDIAR